MVFHTSPTFQVIFKGEYIHSRDYFKNNNYVGKTVVVIGVGIQDVIWPWT